MPSSPLTLVITGTSGTGKSTLCRRVIDEARRLGIGVGGVVAEARTADGRVAGLDAVDVLTGDRVALAEYDRPTGGPVTGRWHFHPAAFEIGLDWFRRTKSDEAISGAGHRSDVAQGFSPASTAGLKARPTPSQASFFPPTDPAHSGPCHLLIVDELGPLELVQGLGWAPLLPLLRTHDGPVIAVVRPSLVDAFAAAMGDRVLMQVEVTPETREAAFDLALAALGLSV